MALSPLASRMPTSPAKDQLLRGSISIKKEVRDQVRQKQVVNVILAAIVVFQLINLPGAILMHSTVSIGTVLLGLVLCAIAMIFNFQGRVIVVSILLIAVVDLGCGLMLLTTPMGLDASDLPIFDVLIVSEIIAVSLISPISVFPVALSNIVFIIADLLFQPRTMELNMVLKSDMAYNAISQPIALQIVVAVVSFVWVRNALFALSRADRAEEIAEMRRKEAERQQILDEGVQHLSQVLTQAANGDRTARANMSQDNMLWRVGSSLNLLLTRTGRMGALEQENRQLRLEVVRVTELWHVSKTMARHRGDSGSHYGTENRNQRPL